MSVIDGHRGHRKASPMKASTASTHRITCLAVALMLTLSLLAGCGSSSSGSGQSITLYNGQHEQTTDSLVAGFEKATGVKVNVRNDDEDTLADEIVTEGSNSPADVVYTENSPALVYLQSKGLLAPVDPSTLAQTPSRFNSPQGDWLGVSARVSVLIYNPSLISASQLPTSVMQLAEPRYKGKLALAAGETDFQPIVTSVARTYGQAAALKWLEAIKSNATSHIYPDNETIANEVNRGAAAFGVVNQYYWYRMQAELGASNVQLQDRLLRPARPRLCARYLDRGYPQILHAQGRRAEVPRLPRQQARSGDHRSLDQLRVPDRLGSQHHGTRDPLRSAPTEPDHDSRARRRIDRDRAAAQGRAAVTQNQRSTPTGR